MKHGNGTENLKNLRGLTDKNVLTCKFIIFASPRCRVMEIVFMYLRKGKEKLLSSLLVDIG